MQSVGKVKDIFLPHDMINRELVKCVSKLYQFLLQIVLKSTLEEDAALPTLQLPVLGCISDGIMERLYMEAQV